MIALLAMPSELALGGLNGSNVISSYCPHHRYGTKQGAIFGALLSLHDQLLHHRHSIDQRGEIWTGRCTWQRSRPFWCKQQSWSCCPMCTAQNVMPRRTILPRPTCRVHEWNLHLNSKLTVVQRPRMRGLLACFSSVWMTQIWLSWISPGSQWRRTCRQHCY